MVGAPKFGSQSCPRELENEEEEDHDFLSAGHKKKKALLKPSLPNSTDVTMMDINPLPTPTGLEIVPYNNQSPPHEPSASRNSANPKVTAPVSPSIEDLGNPRVAESGNYSPNDPENPGHSEGMWALDDATHGGTLPGASRGFKRLTKGHRNSVGHAKTEHAKGPDVGSSQKTELQREMELYEEAEREEEARLLTSLRHNQTGDCSPSAKSPNSMESIQADWKRGSGRSSGEQPRNKRGRKAVISPQASRKEEDVCFACFDGGDLILCDKRSCPKAYHMECTGRESEFFRKKGQWFCGWHVCAHCSRSATSHCYTCPNAYCNGCVKEADFLGLRKSRGLCEQCYRIVYMIEHNLSIDSEGEEVNFDDEETYECLFRGYWKDMKEKLSLSWSDINRASKAKDAGEPHGKCVRTERLTDVEDSTDSDCRPAKRQSQRLKRKRGGRNAVVDDASSSDFEEEEQEEAETEKEEEEEVEEESLEKPKRGRRKRHEFIGWASKELVNFLHSLKEDSKKPLSLLLLNKLMLSYVEANKLSNPRRRGQIRCDERLQILFGKKHVGKFQMMKLLNKHIASKKTTNAKSLGIIPGRESNANFDNDDNKLHKQRKSRKKVDDLRHSKSDPSKYAAIDVNNISLIYLKRSLLEDLQKDSNFESKVKGAFVRIRVPSLINKNDTCYRLVQIVGVKQVLNPRSKAKGADVVLEILNLQKREEITGDLISGQDFTEEECQRLRQSVKCGLLKSMTVGELREKAGVLREAKVKDWFNTELLRLSHLRDRASEKGLKKDLRECVERLEVLNSPSERERRLRAPIEVNVDPCMDPDYESDNAGNSMKGSQGMQSPCDTGLGKKQWDRNNSFTKHVNHQDNGGWAEAAPNSGRWETNSKVAGWGDQQDNLHSGKPVQDWNATSTDKDVRAGNSRMGSRDDAAPANHHAASLNRRGSLSQKDAAEDHNAVGWSNQGEKKEDGGVGITNDDGWGEDFKGGQQGDGWGDSLGDPKTFDQQDFGWGDSVGDPKKSIQQDFGWGDSVVDVKKSDGWGEKGDGLENDDGWEGGNTKGEKGAGNAMDTTKTNGWGAVESIEKDDEWGAVGSIKKDEGWNCNPEGLRQDASNQKKNTREANVGGGVKECSRGNNLGTNAKGGWGNGRNHDGWGRNAGVDTHNTGWGHSGGDARKKGGWGRSSAEVESHNDGWGHTGGGSGNDDGWGDAAGGGESGGGWGNFAGNNEKHATWGAEMGGNEAKTGSGWGNKTSGNRIESGWGANASGAERNRSWNNRGSFRDAGFNQKDGKPRADTGSFREAGFDRRDGKPRAETGPPPYRETGGFGRATSANPRTAVPDVPARARVAIENEREKIWYYQDPSKTTQGPFSMEQLRKWEKTKLFPLNLKIWRVTESQDASILLTDALQGTLRNDLPPGFDHPGRGSREDARNAHVSGGGRQGSNWQDKGGRPPPKYNDWGPERQHASDGGVGGARPERPWGSEEQDKFPPRDGGWEGSKGGYWNRGSSHRSPSDHHHSSRPGNEGRFSSKRNFPCRYFAQGMCKKGDECDFMH